MAALHRSPAPENSLPLFKNETPILSLADWESHAGPQGTDQWVDGRSAKEVARAWIDSGDDLPKEIATLLKRADGFGPVTSWKAEPRSRLRSDDFGGEPRTGDLLVDAEDAEGAYLIAIEAKTDEPFGETVADTLAAAVERQAEDAQSDAVARVTRLVTALLGPRREGDPMINGIRHQLLTACAGCLLEAEARGRTRALLLIQEFVTDRTADKKLLINAIDLGRFVKRLSHGAVNAVNAGEICGPFAFPSSPVALYIGKVSRNARSRRA